MRSLHFILLFGLASLLSSCVFDDEKVGNYPLPRTYAGGQSETTLMNQIQDTTTLGENGQLGKTDEVPILPPGGDFTPTVPTPNPTTTSSIPKNTSSAGSTNSGAKNSKGYPVATPVPGDPTHVISPHDGKKYRILGANGRPLASGTTVAPNKNDPSKAFVIP